jgi:hypothetical protein
MQRKNEDFSWAVAWFVAAALALLLFGVMSLLTLRSARTPSGVPAPDPGVTLTSGATPGAGAAGAGTDVVSAAGEDETPQPPGFPAAGTQAAPDPTAAVGLWLSAFSAITALVGLVSSLWLGWRKERREVAQHQWELERTRLEVAKLRRELAAQESSNSDPDATSARLGMEQGRQP